MTAESDIAAIDDGGANTAAEVRTALTSVLARADKIVASMSRNSSDQTLANAQDQFEFEVKDFDTHGSLADVANDRFVIPTGEDGVYEVSINWPWGATPPVEAIMEFQVNGTSTGTALRIQTNAEDNFGSMTGSTMFELAAADIVTMVVDTNTSSVVARGHADDHLRTRFWIKRVG